MIKVGKGYLWGVGGSPYLLIPNPFLTSSLFGIAIGVFRLGRQDSNLDQRIQSPVCCRYTTPQ